MSIKDVCKYRVVMEGELYHEGGTALRVESISPMDRCMLRPKKDKAGRVLDPIRWIGSGGNPMGCLEPCDIQECPLRVVGDVGHYGQTWSAPCPICGAYNSTKEPGMIQCRECGEFLRSLISKEGKNGD